MVATSGLEAFIVEAKAATYVGNGKVAPPCRTDSHDLTYENAEWSYRDSYFGGTDFLGQETVWRLGKAVWAMNYYGHIMRPDLINAERAGHVIKQALTLLYNEGRFLGGFSCRVDGFDYHDFSTGTYQRFRGLESISKENCMAYELCYHGGLVKA
jgi:hypothetical protein